MPGCAVNLCVWDDYYYYYLILVGKVAGGREYVPLSCEYEHASIPLRFYSTDIIACLVFLPSFAIKGTTKFLQMMQWDLQTPSFLFLFLVRLFRRFFYYILPAGRANNPGIYLHVEHKNHSKSWEKMKIKASCWRKIHIRVETFFF